jgi:hypothetical protein
MRLASTSTLASFAFAFQLWLARRERLIEPLEGLLCLAR